MLTNHTFVLTTPSWNIKLPDRYYQINMGLSTKFVVSGFWPQLMPTNCSAAKQLSQFCKHSKSADLLRKSLLSHVWRVPSSKALSCEHERLFDLLTLAHHLKIYPAYYPDRFPPEPAADTPVWSGNRVKIPESGHCQARGPRS